MTAPKDEQAEAFTLEDIIKEFGSAAQDPAEPDAAAQPADEAAAEPSAPAQPESAEPAEPVEGPAPVDTPAEETPDAPADATPEVVLEPAPAPEAPAKKQKTQIRP